MGFLGMNFGFVPPSVSSGSSSQDLQQVLDYGNVLTNDNNFQGTDSGTNNTGINNIGFGQTALFNNTGSNCIGIGYANLYGNQNNGVNGIGFQNCVGNTGLSVNGIGHYNLENNSGYSVNGIGFQNCSANTEINVNGIGNSTLLNNGGNNANAIGESTLSGNSGNNVNAIGNQAGLNNQGSECNFIGLSSGFSNNLGQSNNLIGGSVGFIGGSNINNNIIGFNTGFTPQNLVSDITFLGAERSYAEDFDSVVFLGTNDYDIRIYYGSLPDKRDVNANTKNVLKDYDGNFNVCNLVDGITVSGIFGYQIEKAGVYGVDVANGVGSSAYMFLPDPIAFNGQFITVINYDQVNEIIYGTGLYPSGSNVSITNQPATQLYWMVSIGNKWRVINRSPF